MGLTIEPVRRSEEDTYLAYLNECFPGWGDQTRIEWAFRRDSGAGTASLLFARFDDEIIGGTAVTYRRVLHPGGRESKIGIMTGSWVLAAARGKGCFTQMIAAMSDCTKKRGGSLLVAYAFQANPSYRAMKRAGLAIVETSYLRDWQEYELADALAPLESLSVGDRSQVFTDDRATIESDRVRYVYTPEAWNAQFLHGPNPPAYLELPGGSVALVEEAGGFLRVQALAVKQRSSYPEAVAALLEFAKRRQHRLFLFSVEAALTRAAEELGCERIPGAYFLKIVHREALAAWAGWDDPASLVESDLTDESHAAYLGAWEIQNRDRM